jgi:hypothetical protein
MGAPEGNSFWKLRSKHGREKIFSTPDILWEAATEYFQWCEDNPWAEQDWVGKNGDEVKKYHPRPFTLSGLCVYLDCSEQTIRDYGKRNDFIEVYTRIEQIMRTQKFEGAATGFFNANIIARDLGLVDKSESKETKKIDIEDFSNLSDEELKQLVDLQKKALGK